MNETFTIKAAQYTASFAAFAPDELCRVNADGTTIYHWDRIEAAASRWKPGCAGIAVCVAKLLLPLRDQRDMLLEALKALLNAERSYEYGGYSEEEIAALDKTRAAIKAAEGGK